MGRHSLRSAERQVDWSETTEDSESLKLEKVESHSELFSDSLEQGCAGSVFLGNSDRSCRGARETSRSAQARLATGCFLAGYIGSHLKRCASCGGAGLARTEKVGPMRREPLLQLQEKLKGQRSASWTLGVG